MRFTSLYLILSLIPNFLFAQTAFEGNGEYVTNASYFVYSSKMVDFANDLTLIIWDQRDTHSVRAVWGHLLNSDGDLITEGNPIRFSNPQHDASLGDACLVDDGIICLTWFEKVGERQVAVFAQRLNREMDLLWDQYGRQIGADFEYQIFFNSLNDLYMKLMPNDVQSCYIIRGNYENRDGNKAVFSLDENAEFRNDWNEDGIVLPDLLRQAIPDNNGGFWYNRLSFGGSPYLNRFLPDGSLLWDNDVRVVFPGGGSCFLRELFVSENDMLFGVYEDEDNSRTGAFIRNAADEQIESEWILDDLGIGKGCGVDQNNRLYYTYPDADGDIRLSCWEPLGENHRPWEASPLVFEVNENLIFVEAEFLIISEEYLTLFFSVSGRHTKGMNVVRYTLDGEPVWGDHPKELLESDYGDILADAGQMLPGGDVRISMTGCEPEIQRNIPYFEKNKTFHFRLDENGQNVWGDEPLNVNLGDYDDPEDYRSIVTHDGIYQSYWRDRKRGIVTQRINERGEASYSAAGNVLLNQNNFTDWTPEIIVETAYLFLHNLNAVEDGEEVSQIIALDAEGEPDWVEIFDWDDYSGIPQYISNVDENAVFSAKQAGQDQQNFILFNYDLRERRAVWSFVYTSPFRDSEIIDVSPWQREDWLIISYKPGEGLGIDCVNERGERVWEQSVIIDSDEVIKYMGQTIFEDHVEVFALVDLPRGEEYGNLFMYDISEVGEVRNIIEMQPFEGSSLYFENCELLRSEDSTIWIKSQRGFQALTPEYEPLLGERGLSTGFFSSNWNQFCLNADGECWMFWSNEDNPLSCTRLNQSAEPASDFWSLEGTDIIDPNYMTPNVSFEAICNRNSDSVYLTVLTQEAVDYQSLLDYYPLQYRVQLVGDQWLNVEGQVQTPQSTMLLSAYPNPFNSTTSISYALPTQSHVTLKIYNTRGQLVDELVNGVMAAGRHSVVWDGRKAGAGVYFVDCVSDQGRLMGCRQKVVLLK